MIHKFNDLAEVEDHDILPIVQLLQQKQREAAYAQFHKLCASINDLLSHEAMLLSQRIHDQARAVA